MKEREVSRYLNRRVKELGGEIRRVQWIGRNNAPDKLVMLPGGSGWVEEKATGVAARKAQEREHERLRKAGIKVFCVDSVGDVDRALAALRYAARDWRFADYDDGSVKVAGNPV